MNNKDLLKHEKTDLRSQGYGIIPKAVMLDTSLHFTAKAIYAYFCSYAGASESCFPSRSKICHDLGMSKDTFTKYTKQLVDNGYISIEQVCTNGRFDHNVYTLLSEKSIKPCTSTVSDNLGHGDFTVSDNIVSGSLAPINNSNINNIKEKDISNKLDISKKKVEKKSTFKKPTADEVRDYCLSANINIDADRFIDFYESKGWKVGSAPMKDWKAAVRNWSRRENNTPARTNPAQNKPMSSPSANKSITPGSFSSFTLEDLESKVNRRYEAKAQEMMDRYERDLGINTKKDTR